MVVHYKTVIVYTVCSLPYCLSQLYVSLSLCNVLEPLVSPFMLPRVSFIERMVAVHQFMKDHKLGKGLLKRVDEYFELLWHQSK